MTSVGIRTRVGAEPHPHEPARLLLRLPILRQMRTVDGWLTDDEADLLIAALTRTLGELPEEEVVELGCYCGRATVVLGGVVRALRPAGRVTTIDPHDGVVGALDTGARRMPPTLPRLRQAVADSGLVDTVEIVSRRPYEVVWTAPVGFLLLDGLHDYASVSRDFWHFEPSLADGARVAFHDYADYFPGVMAFVDELVASPRYEVVRRVDAMVLLRVGSAP
jgi:hypothetical protein